MATTQRPADVQHIIENDGFDALADLITEATDADAVAAVIDNIDFEALVDDLEGRSGLRTKKPETSGLADYIWRHARFHGGHDTSMPVMASSDLQKYLDDHGIDAEVTGVLNDAGKELTSALGVVVDAALLRLGENPMKAAERWEDLIA
jgi:hypothetical protein